MSEVGEVGEVGDVGDVGDVAWAGVEALARALNGAWGCWAPTLTWDATNVAYVSDRRGRPELWVQEVADPDSARVLPVSADPVLAVAWSPDGAWLACSVATGSGVRTEVWAVRPDGSDARRLAGGDRHAALGPWSRHGHRVVVTLAANEPGQPSRCLLIDPDDGSEEPVASGVLVDVLDLSDDERFVLLRAGSRGAQYCRLVDRLLDVDHGVLPFQSLGSTGLGLLRAGPHDDLAAMVAYVVTDAGMHLRSLVAVPIGPDGVRAAAGALAERDDAELDLADADAEGRHILLVWNAAGRSEVDVLDTATGWTRRFEDLPGDVVSGGVLARSGRSAVLAVEGPATPRRLWELDLETARWRPVTPPVLDVAALPAGTAVVAPTLEELESHDGLRISGWLYRSSRADGQPSHLAYISLHGGPEAQERPVYNPQHQVMAAAGITVFAPNIRGSSGFGRSFVHADDRYGRLDAIDDIESCAGHLVAAGLADGGVAVGGRSYGGYATLMALARHARRYVAGIDICGMSDLLTFFHHTEPWIAQAATTKYGDPARDRALLAELSPMRYAAGITAPLLVVHGELDTNVPIGEAHQIVGALRRLGRRVDYLQLDGEGHEYRSVDAKLRLIRAMVGFLLGASATNALALSDGAASTPFD